MRKQHRASLQEGTKEWFENARQRCVDHLRALISVRAAWTYASTLVERWSSENVDVLAGLHLASVIAYTRPFTPALTKGGKVTYPLSELRAHEFDRRLHEHLMNLRNRLLAHADYGVLLSTMYLQTIGDEELPVAIGLNVKGLAGIESRVLAERYQAHFRVCAKAIEERLNVDLRQLASEGQKYPAVFNATGNLPVTITQAKVSREWAMSPEPAGPAGNVEEPSFPEGLSGYRYLQLRHQLGLLDSGTYTIKVNGVPTEIEFDVIQSEKPPAD